MNKFNAFNIIWDKSSDFVKSPFRYPGGKFYGLKYILPFINCVDHDEYREPFLGGGNIFFAKNKASINWLNDLYADLIITYKILSNSIERDKLIGLVTKEEATRERHAEMVGFNPDNELEVAYRTYYLNRTSYSGITKLPSWGYAEGKSSPPPNWRNFLVPAGEKLRGTKLTSIDFEKVIVSQPKGKQVFMYLDPPYFHADQKRAYNESFSIEDHNRLALLLKNTPYLFCLSYDDCLEIRNLYDWAYIHERSWFYNTANTKGNSRKLGNELIITNYDVILPSQKDLFDN